MKEGRNSQRNKDVKNMNPPHFLCPKNLNGHFLYQNEIDVVAQKNTRHTYQNSENNSKSHTLIGLWYPVPSLAERIIEQHLAEADGINVKGWNTEIRKELLQSGILHPEHS